MEALLTLCALAVTAGVVVYFLVVFDNNKKNEHNANKVFIESFIEHGFDKVFVSNDQADVYGINTDAMKIAHSRMRSSKRDEFEISNIINIEFIEDSVIVNSGSRSISGAIVGGVIAGGVGAIIGGLGGENESKKNISSIKLKIYFNDTQRPVLTMTFYDGPKLEKYGPTYKKCHEMAESCYGVIRALKHSNDKITVNQYAQVPGESFHDIQLSVGDELAKLYQLLEKGVITESEFLEIKGKIISNA